jgi:hypothetical protein
MKKTNPNLYATETETACLKTANIDLEIKRRKPAHIECHSHNMKQA